MSLRGRQLIAVAVTAVLSALGLLAGAPAAQAAPAPAAVAAPFVAAPAWHQPRLTLLASKARWLTTRGIPYSLGGHGPRPAPVGSSVDCSGLIRSLYGYAFGVDIGSGNGDSMVRTSGRFVPTSRPVPGDVLLVGHGGRAPAYHAAVYVGNDDGHPTAVGSPDFGYNILYQHPWTRYWAGDVMGYWHYRGADEQDSATSLTPPPPPAPTLARMRNETVTTGDQVISASGWAYDPARPTAATVVQMWVDGRHIANVLANRPRPDVNRAYKIGGNHGFAFINRFLPGPHQVRFVAAGVPGDGVHPVSSASYLVGVHSSMPGRVERWNASGGTVTASGWNFDLAAPTAGTRIRLIADGRILTNLSMPNLARRDVNVAYRAYGVAGNHGFQIGARISARHRICVESIPTSGYSSSPTILGCAVLTS